MAAVYYTNKISKLINFTEYHASYRTISFYVYTLVIKIQSTQGDNSVLCKIEFRIKKQFFAVTKA